jgi:hypothetical protein
VKVTERKTVVILFRVSMKEYLPDPSGNTNCGTVVVTVGAVDTEVDVVVTLRGWSWSVYPLVGSGFGIGG